MLGREDEGYLRGDEEYFVCDVLCEDKKNKWGTGETRLEIHDSADSIMTAFDISVKELLGRV